MARGIILPERNIPFRFRILWHWRKDSGQRFSHATCDGGRLLTGHRGLNLEACPCSAIPPILLLRGEALLCTFLRPIMLTIRLCTRNSLVGEDESPLSNHIQVRLAIEKHKSDSIPQLRRDGNLKKLLFICANCGHIRVAEYDILEEIENSRAQPLARNAGRAFGKPCR
jgi:hypothetical protein